MWRRIIGALTATVLAVMATMALGSTPAMAAWNDCPAAQFCWWQHANAQGAWGHRLGSEINAIGCWSMGSWGNQASSWRNRTPWDITLHDAGNCTGSSLYLGPGDNQANLVGAYNDWLGGVSAS